MKLLHLTFHYEFTDAVEKILDGRGLLFIRYPMMEGKDPDGKHYGTKVYPGNTTVVHAQVPEAEMEALIGELRAFQKEKKSHNHLQALFLPVERSL